MKWKCLTLFLDCNITLTFFPEEPSQEEIIKKLRSKSPVPPDSPPSQPSPPPEVTLLLETRLHSHATFLKKWGSVTHQVAASVPSISCCVLNHHDLFYQIHNALAFNRDTCCHLALSLQLLPFHCIALAYTTSFNMLYGSEVLSR